jgi:hypothetical protein
MISFSKAMGAVFFMGERAKVGERRAVANKKIARGGTHKY